MHVSGYKTIDFPCPQYTMWCWDAWREWLSNEIKTHGAERRVQTQELTCPLCGGEAYDKPMIYEKRGCSICSGEGPSYYIFFNTRCPSS